jgi:hypothetical protein
MIGRTQAPLIELFLEGMKLQRREETNITKVYSLEDGWRLARRQFASSAPARLGCA